jgi:hypothetical protein
MSRSTLPSILFDGEGGGSDQAWLDRSDVFACKCSEDARCNAAASGDDLEKLVLSFPFVADIRGLNRFSFFPPLARANDSQSI